MRKLILATFVLFSLACFSQDLNENITVYKPNNYFIGDSVLYVVGSKDYPNYPIRFITCSKTDLLTFRNGRSAAGLSHMVLDKNDYVGGFMTFHGDTTIIKDISIKPIDNDVVVTVEGSDFVMKMTIDNGAILSDDENKTTFLTDDIGIWEINKKTLK